MIKLFKNELKSGIPFPISETLFEDLDIDGFLRRYFKSSEAYITRSPSAIAERNAICAALLDNTVLFDAVRHLHYASVMVCEASPSSDGDPVRIIQSMKGVRALYDAALEAIGVIEEAEGLPSAFAVMSEGLTKLVGERYPRGFTAAWDKYVSGTERLESLSLYIGFSEELTMDKVALSGVYDRKFTKSAVISRVTGKSEPMSVDSLLTIAQGADESLTGTANLNTHAGSLQRFSGSVRQLIASQVGEAQNQLLSMERGLKPYIAELAEDLDFALGMVSCAREMKDRFGELSFAEIRPEGERSLCLKGMVHPLIAEKSGAVPNDIAISSGGEIILLGGVNRGGKTTYLRTAGALQVLFQLGLPLPARWGAISPASGIFSVFSREENTELYQGKLGRELAGMRDAMAATDENGLFLGNEPISATSPAESRLLSVDSLCILKARRARGIWVTHLYGLFDDAERLNRLEPGSRFEFMRASPGSGEDSFLILPGRPEGYSGAREVYSRL